MRPVPAHTHPLLRAMALLTRAKRVKAHRKVIRRLEARVEAEAERTRNVFAPYGGIREFAKTILPKKPYPRRRR